MEAITITLVPDNGSFQGKKVLIVSQPICIGRAIENAPPDNNPSNIKFNSKVVSRNHAKILHENGKFYLQDTKSSSGTFLNGERLSPQGTESRLFELHDGDQIRLGEDYQGNGGNHQSISMKIRLPGGRDIDDEQEQRAEEIYVDPRTDPDLAQIVDDEFNQIWNSLVADINSPLKRLRENAAKKSKKPTLSETQNTTPTSTGSLVQHRDATVTLIKTPGVGLSSTPEAKDDAAASVDAIALIEGLTWETPELKENLLELARKQDQQLLVFYRTLKGFPSSFVNVASKYARYARN